MFTECRVRYSARIKGLNPGFSISYYIICGCLLLCVLLFTVFLYCFKEKNQCIRGKMGAQNIVKEIKTVPGKVATTRTEDGQK